MTCGFCAKDTPVGRVFIGVERAGGSRDCICCDCVLDLYVVMTAAGMRPLERVRKRSRSAPSKGMEIIRLDSRRKR
jgi:hypothetical protein